MHTQLSIGIYLIKQLQKAEFDALYNKYYTTTSERVMHLIERVCFFLQLPKCN